MGGARLTCGGARASRGARQASSMRRDLTARVCHGMAGAGAPERPTGRSRTRARMRSIRHGACGGSGAALPSRPKRAMPRVRRGLAIARRFATGSSERP